MNVIGKLFNSILLKKLENWVRVSKVISKSQAGFRKGYSTHNLFSLVTKGT